MKKILVVGGEGYIGQIVCSELVDKNHEVISYDNLIYGQKTNSQINKKPNFRFVNGDIRDSLKIRENLENVNAVIILAGLVGDPITKKYPGLSTEINQKGIKNLIDECAGYNIENVIFVSTCSNYGLIENDELAKEDHELNPLSSYARDKVDIEKYILSLKGKVNSCFTILRFATAFGLSSRMRYDLTVNEFTRDIFNSTKLEVYDPDTWRPYCHVQDFANILLLILNTEKSKILFEVFNAGSDENNHTKRMIVEKILKFVNFNEVYFVNNKGSDPRNYKVNFQKLNSVLGYQCKYLVDDGINEILTHLQISNENSFKSTKDLGNYTINI
ncbi:NAD-dependent epimerase/dehydratase family protein [Candidatus Pelagibacter bacterium nBUS_27]|uniref:NAD-dependent epimerase/dehydratase family protein n=1 Tax=Candidatus Pelagibacter bacterium nBUS_27 TaxID=3374188 RepID=UPI003EBE18F4